MITGIMLSSIIAAGLASGAAVAAPKKVSAASERAATRQLNQTQLASLEAPTAGRAGSPGTVAPTTATPGTNPSPNQTGNSASMPSDGMGKAPNGANSGMTSTPDRNSNMNSNTSPTTGTMPQPGTSSTPNTSMNRDDIPPRGANDTGMNGSMQDQSRRPDGSMATPNATPDASTNVPR